MKITIFQGVVYGVFIFAAIVGVFVFSLYSGRSEQDAIGPVVIWGSLSSEEFGASLAAALQTNQGLRGVSYVPKNEATIESELLTAIAEGTGPDLVLISHESLSSLDRVISPIPATTLSERDFKDAFATGAEIFLLSDGSGSYGIPFLIDPLVLYHNRRVLASSGIARPPTTWEELSGLVSRVTTRTVTGNISQALIALGTYANVHNARGILSTLFFQSGVPIASVSSNGLRRANLGTAQSQGAPIGRSVVAYFTEFADPAKVSYTWNASLPDSQTRFLSGDLALYLGYASEAGFLRASNPNLDFDVAPVPQLGVGAGKVTHARIYGFVVPRGSKNPGGAFQVAAALTDLAPNQAASAATHMAPVARLLLAERPSAPDAAVAYASALYARGWLSPSTADTDAIFSRMITDVTSGRLQIDAALSFAENSLTSLLQQ